MATFTYYHDLSPFIFRITETFGIRWYSLAYVIGAVAIYFIAVYLQKLGRISFSKGEVLDMITYVAVGVVLGGRVGYCVFYSPEIFLDFSAQFPFWGVLRIHEGGMSSHGGIVGALFASLVCARVYKLSMYSILDLTAVGAALGLFFGRIANFINGELYGRIIEQKALLGVKFPLETFLWLEKPELYHSKLLSLQSVLVHLKGHVDTDFLSSASAWGEWIAKIQDPAYYNKVNFMIYQIVSLSQKGNVAIQEALMPLLSLRHPSQFYQAFFGGLIPFCIVFFLWSKRSWKPGVISLIWVVLYLGARILTEFFRMPDAHIGYEWLSLTRGQWLSLLVFVGAAVYGFFIYRQNPKGFIN